MTTDPFEGVLDPFAWWNLASTYDKYADFFDLVIYCTIFIALAHSVLANRFPGRPGKALATVIGISLGVSMVLVQHRFSWSLRQASPIAALLALLLIGILVLHTLLRIHISWILAAPLTYIIVYLFVRAVSPQAMAAIAAHAPFVHVLAAVMFLICLWRIGVALWPEKGHFQKETDDNVAFVVGLNRKQEKQEAHSVKDLKRNITSQARYDMGKVQGNLRSVHHELQQHTPRWESIAKATSTIIHEADDAREVVDRVRTLDRQLRNFDWQALQQLSSYLSELSDEDQRKLKDQIQAERRKIVQEHAIEELTTKYERTHEEFRRTVNALGSAAVSQDRQSALQNHSQAESLEQELKKDMKKLLNAEKKLLALTKKKIHKEK